ncbi:3-bisphosphoglycerate-independent phosphoglycerate mutase [Striga asiatica]|uniref:3-bisphosphoglycerate-independent phosphoglycerate mutase n=1 Tax=Striga asiatica TaxID=4170 RepID=A0A5A7PFQ6_STRAF|nr:3-bisphosphoglycerate-independent phosphoglycerate mutase [Striga asiatica]
MSIFQHFWFHFLSTFVCGRSRNKWRCLIMIYHSVQETSTMTSLLKKSLQYAGDVLLKSPRATVFMGKLRLLMLSVCMCVFAHYINLFFRKFGDIRWCAWRCDCLHSLHVSDNFYFPASPPLVLLFNLLSYLSMNCHWKQEKQECQVLINNRIKELDCLRKKREEAERSIDRFLLAEVTCENAKSS